MGRGREIAHVLRAGRSLRGQLLDVRYVTSASDRARAAVLVAKFGYSAVARNRLKRRLRELVRMHMLPTLGTLDVLLRARREAYAADFAALRDDVLQLATRLARSAPAAEGG